MGLFRRKEKEEAYQALLLQLGRIANSLETITQKDNGVVEQNSVDQLTRIASSLEENCQTNESQTQHEALAQLNRIAASLETSNENDGNKSAQASLDQLNRIAFALENGNVHNKAEEQQLSAQLVRIAETLDQQCKKKPDEITVAQLTQLTKIADSLERISLEKKIEQTLNDKLKAAYALNLCLVSISQIIDYSDLYILEQEYEGILNNLNLEHMPKDEALLDILRQILDTITFFRIQEGDKQFIEKEYQDKMKTAIWSAVPSCGAILACSDPAAMLLTLVTQVGTGYMNYRKTKAEAGRDKEKAEWELHKAAIEQFNGLRRELFTTAWKLADNYGFKDEWRLTESQITQYNRILIDQNYSRRLARLEDIEGKFEAYPPFWYFKGNTALKLSQENQEIRDDMLAIARDAYEKYFAVNSIDNELLRTDPICAACALEYVSLLPDTEKNTYIQRAIKSAGTHFDILQMCAMAYLDIGETDKAANILRGLVCESYNESVNAQLLSTIYIAQHLKDHNGNQFYGQYQRLLSLTDEKHLLKWPDGETIDEQFAEFRNDCRISLLNEYANFLCNYYYQKSKEFIALGESGSEEVFVQFARKIEKEINGFPGVNIAPDVFAGFMQKHENEMRKFVKSGKKYDNAAFDLFFSPVLFKAAKNISRAELTTMEQITDFLLQVESAESTYLVEDAKQRYGGEAQPVYNITALCSNATGESDEFKEIKDAVLKADLIKGNPKNTTLLVAGSVEYYRYIRDHNLQGLNVVAVINDRTINDCDLLITTTGLLVHRGQSKAAKMAKGTILAATYGAIGVAVGVVVDKTMQFIKNEVHYSAIISRANKLERPYYSNKHVDMEKLCDFIDFCKRKFSDSVYGKLSQIIVLGLDLTDE